MNSKPKVKYRDVKAAVRVLRRADNLPSVLLHHVPDYFWLDIEHPRVRVWMFEGMKARGFEWCAGKSAFVRRPSRWAWARWGAAAAILTWVALL